MNKFKRLKNLSEATFKRLVGVKRETYEVMVEEYKKAEQERKKAT